MKSIRINHKKPIALSAGIALSAMFLFSTSAMAELSADVQSKIKTYQSKLADWAKDPEVIAAIIERNSSPKPMDNKSWKSLPPSDPSIQQYLSSSAAKKLSTWQQDKSLGKLFIRDKNGDFVAGSKKPAIYNISDRAPFKNAMKGNAWNANKAKKDPTTNLPSVQLSYPVVENGENIGIIHTAIILD